MARSDKGAAGLGRSPQVPFGQRVGGRGLAVLAGLASLLLAALLTVDLATPGLGGFGGGPWLDGRMRMAHAAIGYAASTLEAKTETYANVAQITLEAIRAYAEDVRASRQIKGAPPVEPAS